MKDQATSKIEAIEFFSREECALILRNLFDRKELWENRLDRRSTYRNGEWFTVGSNLYLDLLSEEEFPAYKKKVDYFNSILQLNFGPLLTLLTSKLSEHFKCPVAFLEEKFRPAGLPGFHIFPPHETFQAFFGKVHTDQQYETLLKLPGFPFEIKDPYSFTIPLCLPYLGGGMYHEEGICSYRVGHCYIHDGLSKHAIAAYQSPVLPMDWRISIQAHGFKNDGVLYLYW